MLKARYNFVDISVFSRIGENEYVNLTDYSFTGENEKIELSEPKRGTILPKFLMMFFSFMKKERYAAPVTVPELLALANITNKNFPRQIAYKLEEDVSQEIIAIMCAKKIMEYDYGKCVRMDTDDVVYAFQRQKFVDKKRVYPTVFTKKFYPV